MGRKIDDPEFVQGQLDALRAIILGLANLTTEPREFLAESLQRIEAARNVVLGSPASDEWLAGIEDEENWLRHVVS